jgi:hypothetical protein
MCRTPLPPGIAVAGLILAAQASRAPGQTDKIPTISARQYVGGSAKVTVTWAAKIDQDVAINTQASISDGEMTWLQFGASGSEEPNALITYPGEIGITAGIMAGEKPKCSGTVEVTAKLISGHYTCPGAATHEAATG